MIGVHLIIGAVLKSTRKIYLIAAVISIVLYAAGVGTGYVLQGSVTGLVQGEISKVRSDLSTVDQELPLLSLRGEGSCSVLSTFSVDVNDRLNSILNNIVDLESQGASGEDYSKLVDDYTTLAVRGWILDKDIKQNCEDDTLPTLYFYSVPCADCLEQGQIVSEMRGKYGAKFPVFVLNTGANQPVVKILTRSFNITRTPALIVDSTPLQGLVSSQDLNDLICKKLGEC